MFYSYVELSEVMGLPQARNGWFTWKILLTKMDDDWGYHPDEQETSRDS